MNEACKLLEGLVIADFGMGMATAIVAKFLADNGARIIRVEPLSADPFYDYYPAYGVWRRRAERNSEAASSRAALTKLLDEADGCIIGGEDYPGVEHLYSASDFANSHPRLAILEISGNPYGTPGHGRPSTDLLAQARSGLSYEQFSNRPIAMSFEPANYGAALQGLCALLGALYERLRSGAGQIARTSLYEGALAWVSQLWTAIENPTPAAGVQPKDLHPLIFRCADGVFVHIVVGSSGSKYKLYQVLGIIDPSVKPSDSGMPSLADGPRNYFGDIDLLSEHISRRSSDELLNALWGAGLPAEPVLGPGACWDNPQVQRNQLVETDSGGTRHTANCLTARRSACEGKVKLQRSDGRPLEGVRIIDFGAYVAGPLSSVILADLGAEVIKVEPVKGDPSRGMIRSYMAANRGKKGVALDLKSVKGVELAQRLSTQADIVTNNFRSGVSARLGIDPETLHALRPNLIVLESPGYGSSGPLAQRAAFDLVMQAFCGHEVKGAGHGNAPFWNRTYMVDFAGGMLGAIGLLAALIYRARTGNGVSLETPLLNGGVFLLSELIQKADGRFQGARELNSTQTGYSAFESLYEAKDGWLAIVARNGKARQALIRVLGLTDRLSDVDLAWNHEATEVIAAAVAKRHTAEFAAALESSGVWVEKCQKDRETALLHDPLLQARGTVRLSRHHAYGQVREIGSLYTLSRSRIGTDLPIHDIGEHTREILHALQMEDSDVETLLSEGIIA
jgi:crotonobetainyl-CoA:carnitine CoA-transferase CaiB-like acyl-CoA transferase